MPINIGSLVTYDPDSEAFKLSINYIESEKQMTKQTYEDRSKVDITKVKSIYFMGVAGTGMASVAGLAPSWLQCHRIRSKRIPTYVYDAGRIRNPR